MAAPEPKRQEVSLEEEDEFEEFEVEGEQHPERHSARPVSGPPCESARVVISAARPDRRLPGSRPQRPPHPRVAKCIAADWDARQEDPQKEELWEQVSGGGGGGVANRRPLAAFA
jgi:hypothetical protein